MNKPAKLAIVASAFALHRITLAGPLASIWDRRDETREMYLATQKVLDKSTSLARTYHVTAVFFEEQFQGDMAPKAARKQAIEESRWNIPALLLTTPTYVHAWREYRTAQILLDRATQRLIEIKHAINTHGDQWKRLQPIIHAIYEHERAVIGEADADTCESCFRGLEYECVKLLAARDDGTSMRPLSCWQEKLLAASMPQPGDWAYDLFKVNK